MSMSGILRDFIVRSDFDIDVMAKKGRGETSALYGQLWWWFFIRLSLASILCISYSFSMTVLEPFWVMRQFVTFILFIWNEALWTFLSDQTEVDFFSRHISTGTDVDPVRNRSESSLLRCGNLQRALGPSGEGGGSNWRVQCTSDKYSLVRPLEWEAAHSTDISFQLLSEFAVLRLFILC